MSPQVRARYKKRIKTVQRNRRILTGIVVFIAAAAIIVLLSVTVLFNVSEVKVVKAGSHYTAEEIIEASGVEVGDNMLLTKWKEVSNKVETKLPYVLTLEIKKTIGGRVSFTVSDDKADKLVKLSKGYAVVDANFKVLEILNDKPKNTQLTMLKIELPNGVEIGNTIDFGEGSKTETVLETIMNAVNEVGLNKITGIDISDVNNIYLEYQSRYRLYLGDNSEILYKLKEAKKIIAEEDAINPNQIGEINLSILKKVYVEPLESLEETTVAKTQVTQVTDTTDTTDTTDSTDTTDVTEVTDTEEPTEITTENTSNMEATAENGNE